MELGLEGAKVLVTGGSRGIGRAIVAGFVAEGASVAFCSRDPELAAQVAAELGSADRVRGSGVDVGDAEALSAWVADSAEQLGGIDCVVANVSALAIPDSEESWEASWRVDVMHTVRLVKAAMPHLERSDNPSIIGISSVSGRESDFAAGPYGTAKTAVVGYLHGLAFSLAEKGIRANAVSPGNTYFSDGVWSGIESADPELYRAALQLNPSGRMGTPEEIAAPVVFLASRPASRISGTNLVADGALTRGIQL